MRSSRQGSPGRQQGIQGRAFAPRPHRPSTGASPTTRRSTPTTAASWFYGQLQGANLTENRWTLAWDPAHPTAINELPFLAARGAEGAGRRHPRHPRALRAHGDRARPERVLRLGARTVAATVKQWGIHDFVVWNEPNTRALLVAAEGRTERRRRAEYEALLAKCYDAIHAADPAANVIGIGLSPRSNGASTEPLAFLAGVGTAYRASGRTGADHGSALDPSVSEPEQPDRLA